jgi:hypothetical protein
MQVFKIAKSDAEDQDIAYVRAELHIDFMFSTSRLYVGKPLISSEREDAFKLYQQRPTENEMPFKALTEAQYLTSLGTMPAGCFLANGNEMSIESVEKFLAPLFTASQFTLKSLPVADHDGEVFAAYMQVVDAKGNVHRVVKVKGEKVEHKDGKVWLQWSKPRLLPSGMEADQLSYVFGSEEDDWEEVSEVPSQ